MFCVTFCRKKHRFKVWSSLLVRSPFDSSSRAFPGPTVYRRIPPRSLRVRREAASRLPAGDGPEPRTPHPQPGVLLT
ncbi:unnamed protein product [Arctogadus glacialis]